MKLLLKSFPRTALLTSILAFSVTASGSAIAASQCKGLDNAACDAGSQCSWVEGYERKDGRKVNAFCRTKAKRVSTKSTQAKAKTTN